MFYILYNLIQAPALYKTLNDCIFRKNLQFRNGTSKKYIGIYIVQIV